MNGACKHHRGLLCVCAVLILAAVSAAADLPDHLVLYYDFDEEGVAAIPDLSGHQNDAVLEGPAGWQDSQYGKALLLDGTKVAATVAPSASLTSLKSPMTVGVLFKPVSLPAGYHKMLGMYGKAGDRGTGWALEFNGSMFDFVLFGKKNYWGPELPAGEWVYIVTVFDGSTVVHYVNGARTAPIAAEGYDTDVSQSPGLWLGAEEGTLNKQPVDVVIDEVWISKKALGEAEVGRVMQGQWRPNPYLAANPIPRDQATEVLRDTVLGWTPGVAAQSHHLYLGVDLDDVNDAGLAGASDLLIDQVTSDSRFDPGRLDFGAVYFWRVDEVNAAPDFTVFKGKVWSFATESLAYPVVPAAAGASSVYTASTGPEKTIDGSGLNAVDQHGIVADDMWLTAAADAERWIRYEFAETQKLHEMWVWNCNQAYEPVLGLGAKDTKIETCLDGVTWTALADVPEFARASGLPSYAHNTVVSLGGVAARHVKLTINANWGVQRQSGLSEVRFFAIPVNATAPQPADGSASNGVDVALEWRPGRDAARHEVYLGTGPDALKRIGATAETTFDPGPLALATTYWWRVVEVNDAEAVVAWEGPLWSFSTAPYVVVDDFESYNDTDRRIYETWIDGYDVPQNGSQAGHLSAPFAERSIVHGGRQSLPLFYDNTTAARSEAELTLAQDWTASGIKTLSLVVQGAAGNTGQLYVKINGAKVSYAGNLATATWQPWSIDLSAVGGNLSRVTSLILGVEGAGAAGLVYIDDIRLYPAAP
jgi:hypothetical protein